MIAGVAVLITVLLMRLRTKENSGWICACNAVIDTLAAWQILYLLTVKWLSGRKLLRLQMRSGVQVAGTVTALSKETERYAGWDCLQMQIGQHRCFEICHAGVSVQEGQTIKAKLVDGILKEVEF